MADTRPDIKIPANTAVDLYAALNAQAGFPAVTVGTKIRVFNKGAFDVYAYAGATAPTFNAASNPGVLIPRTGTGFNDAGDAGAWCYSVSVDGLVNVAVA